MEATQTSIETPPRLAEAFRLLKSGKHICSRDVHVYRDLKQNRDRYISLFNALGYELEYHNHDFFYFKGDNVLKTASLHASALFVLILFQDLEDKKYQNQERQWQKTLLTRFFKIAELPHFATSQRRRMMTAVGVNQENLKERVFKTLKRLGMVEMIAADQFVFLSPIYRFIDVCLEIGEREDFDLNVAIAADSEPEDESPNEASEI